MDSNCITCQEKININNKYKAVLCNLQRNLAILQPNVKMLSDLAKVCIICLESMSHDTLTELSAIASRTDPSVEGNNITIVKQFQEITPEQHAIEYKLVTDRFSSGTIYKIEKNYNVPLFTEYQTAISDKQGDIKLLFHGSNNANYINILCNGFDIKKSRNGSLGVGVYFALDSGYSNLYTGALKVDDETVLKNILLCRIKITPDTMVGSGIWAVPNDRYCYPEYIIYYV